MDLRLDRKTAIVTGGARGIGRGISLEMARSGAQVVIADREQVLGEETVGMIKNEGLVAEFVEVDITDADARERLLERVPRVDILVNNAGITPEGGFLDTGMEEVRKVMEVNFFAHYALTQSIVKRMIEQNVEGNVLFTSSTHQKVTIMRPAYSASKAALGMLVRELALALTPEFGIRVNSVAPGVVAIHGQEDLKTDVVPTGYLAVPEDIGKAMVFLASDAAAHITGHTLVVDGGFSHAHAHFFRK